MEEKEIKLKSEKGGHHGNQSWFFGKINKIDKTLARQTK